MFQNKCLPEVVEWTINIRKSKSIVAVITTLFSILLYISNLLSINQLSMTSRNSQSEDSKGAQFSFLEQKIKARFEVLNKIGSGAYGHVWKVCCKKTGELLAIKKVFLAFQN